MVDMYLPLDFSQVVDLHLPPVFPDATCSLEQIVVMDEFDHQPPDQSAEQRYHCPGYPTGYVTYTRPQFLSAWHLIIRHGRLLE